MARGLGQDYADERGWGGEDYDGEQGPFGNTLTNLKLLLVGAHCLRFHIYGRRRVGDYGAHSYLYRIFFLFLWLNWSGLISFCI